ncbi:MAG: DUF885 domain-containing protein [Litorimonas sp.]
MTLSRRKLLQNSAAAVAILPAFTACSDQTNAPTSGAAPTNGVKPTLAQTKPDVSRILSEATELMLKSHPESTSSAGIDTGKYAHYKSKLTDRSPEGQAAIETDVRAMLTQLKTIDIDIDTLSEAEALNIDVIRTVFQTSVDGFDLPYGDMALLNSNWSYRNSPYAVAQNTGAFVEIPSFLDSSHYIGNSQDADAYLDRMKAYAAQLDGETERTRIAGEQGVILPDFLMEKTLGQLRGAYAQDTNAWGITQSVATRSAQFSDSYAKAALDIAQNHIRPAIQRQIDIHETLAAHTTDKAGVWALPDGDAYYDWALRAGTTTTMSPDEVHEMGLDELASLQSRMDPILRSLGYTNGPVGERMTAISQDPRYHFAKGDAGRAEIMAYIESKVTEIRALMPQAFETLVPGFLDVTRISPDVEAGAPSAYGGAGSIDGKQPGHFWINLRSTDLHTKISLPDLTYHEAIPGHVWQGEYTFKQPLIRSLLAFNAYSEGWALYAEQIADELGVYASEPAGQLGYLQSLAFRACRLVVDTGLHAKRWGREEAIDWFVTNNGSNPEEVRSEVDRYCAWPGQACGYKVGHTAIVQLREKAKAALGPNFNIKQFNDAVVLGGSVPMTVLGRVIDAHIALKKG